MPPPVMAGQRYRSLSRCGAGLLCRDSVSVIGILRAGVSVGFIQLFELGVGCAAVLSFRNMRFVDCVMLDRRIRLIVGAGPDAVGECIFVLSAMPHVLGQLLGQLRVIGCEKGCRMHETFFVEVLDKGSAGVPDARAGNDTLPPQDASSAGRDRHRGIAPCPCSEDTCRRGDVKLMIAQGLG